MSDKSDSQDCDQAGAPAPSGDHRKEYEPPKLTVFGTVAELTRAQLKHSSNADLVNFGS